MNAPNGKRSWFKDNQPIVIFLIGQLLVLALYLIRLETRVALVEKEATANAARTEKIVNVMIKDLHISPDIQRDPKKP